MEVSTEPGTVFAATLRGETGATAKGDGLLLERGSVIGRYMILSQLGMGGMGVVYAAYDPELDRKVALKLVRPGSQGSEGTARLLREAQALARLAHPNVVAVYDTGTFGKQVWLAMEFVDGVTLTEWLERKRREGALGWRDVLRVMEPAGRGLASAHQAGLLHRDFKPDNVMVGADGRVRVMDLGLARTVDSEESLPPVEGLETISGVNGGLRVKVTQAGAILGTPAYMAPEQFLGLPVDTHADQFAFCVTLWEALSGERPFSGDTLVALLTNVTSGKYRLRAKVPRWLRQICERGIQSKTERRYASMDEVLAALRRGRRHAKTRFAFLGLGITLLVLAIVFGLDFVHKQQVGAACTAAGTTFETSWNPDVRQQLTDHTLGLSSKHANETLERLLPHYEDYSEQWQEARTDICHQHKLKETWDDTTFHQALWCLEDRQMVFDDLVRETLMSKVLGNAIPAVTSLPLISDCVDLATLGRIPLPPPGQRDQIRAVRKRLSLVRMKQTPEQLSEALVVAQGALQQAEEIGWKPLLAQLQYENGRILRGLGKYKQSEAIFRQAYFNGSLSGAYDSAANAALSLAIVVGSTQARFEEGLQWGRHAELALASLGANHNSLLWATRSGAIAAILNKQGNYAEARLAQKEALEVRRNKLGENHPALSRTLTALGVLDQSENKWEQARTHHEQAHAIASNAFGPNNANTAYTLANLALVHNALGNLDTAMELHEQVIEIWSHAWGSDHPMLATAYNNLAITQQRKDQLRAAQTSLRHARKIWQKHLGPDHPNVAVAENNLGDIHLDLGEYDAANQMYKESLEHWKSHLGEEHPNLAYPIMGLGRAAFNQAEYADAEKYYQSAQQLREKKLGPTHPLVAETLRGRASVALNEGEYAKAVELSGRAVELRVKEGVPELIAEYEFFHAKALWASNRDTQRELALTYAQRARKNIADIAHRQEFHGEIGKWIAER